MEILTQPFVSVCIQTYNHEQYIEKCLDSVLMQKTSFPMEIVLGEDMSDDNTRILCQEYANKYPKIIKLHLRNREDVIYINGNPTGRYNLMENIKSCSGKYIAFLEGDDYWTDASKLEEQVTILEENEQYSGCFHNTLFINEKEPDSQLKPWRNYMKSVFSLEDTISKRALFHTSSFVFRKNCLKLPPWFPKIQSGDMTMFSVVASRGDLFRIDKAMSVYRKNDTSITNVIRLKKFHKNRVQMFRYYKDTFDSSVLPKVKEVIKYHKSEIISISKQAYKNRIKKLLNK